MPDYDLSQPFSVRITIYGSIVDAAYSKLLIQKTDLSLEEILALDRIQKKLPIADSSMKQLRAMRLIEGRKPNLHVSAYIAQATSNEADYIRTRAQDDTFYTKLILDYLAKFEVATRREIDRLLLTKLSDALTENQKKRKVANLLTKLRAEGRIRNTGSRSNPKWVIVDQK